LLLEELDLQLKIEEENERREQEQLQEESEHMLMEVEDTASHDNESYLQLQALISIEQDTLLSLQDDSLNTTTRADESEDDEVDQWASLVDVSITTKQPKKRGRPAKSKLSKKAKADKFSEEYANVAPEPKRIKKKLSVEMEDETLLPLDSNFHLSPGFISPLLHSPNGTGTSASSTRPGELPEALSNLIPLRGTYLNMISDRSKWMNRVVVSTKDHIIGRTIKYLDGHVHVRTASQQIILAKATNLQLLDESSEQYHDFMEVEGCSLDTDHSSSSAVATSVSDMNRSRRPLSMTSSSRALTMQKKSNIFSASKAPDFEFLLRKGPATAKSLAVQTSTTSASSIDNHVRDADNSVASAADQKAVRKTSNDEQDGSISATKHPARDLAQKIDVFLQDIFSSSFTDVSITETINTTDNHYYDANESAVSSANMHSQQIDFFANLGSNFHHQQQLSTNADHPSSFAMDKDGDVVMGEMYSAGDQLHQYPPYEAKASPMQIDYAQAQVLTSYNSYDYDSQALEQSQRLSSRSFYPNHSIPAQDAEFLPILQRYTKKQLLRLNERELNLAIRKMLSSCRHSTSPTILDEITPESLWESLQYIRILLSVQIKSRKLIEQLRDQRELFITILKDKIEYLCNLPPDLVIPLIGGQESIASLTNHRVSIPKAAQELEEGEEAEEQEQGGEATVTANATPVIIDPKKIRYLTYKGFVDWMNKKYDANLGIVTEMLPTEPVVVSSGYGGATAVSSSSYDRCVHVAEMSFNTLSHHESPPLVPPVAAEQHDEEQRLSIIVPSMEALAYSNSNINTSTSLSSHTAYVNAPPSMQHELSATMMSAQPTQSSRSYLTEQPRYHHPGYQHPELPVEYQHPYAYPYDYQANNNRGEYVKSHQNIAGQTFGRGYDGRDQVYEQTQQHNYSYNQHYDNSNDSSQEYLLVHPPDCAQGSFSYAQQSESQLHWEPQRQHPHLQPMRVANYSYDEPSPRGPAHFSNHDPNQLEMPVSVPQVQVPDLNSLLPLTQYQQQAPVSMHGSYHNRNPRHNNAAHRPHHHQKHARSSYPGPNPNLGYRKG
jgi:hypothetical protein